MEVIAWGLVPVLFGLIGIYATRDFWLALPDWSIADKLMAVAAVIGGLFGFAVAIAALGAVGITAGVGVALLIATMIVVTHRVRQFSDRFWRQVGQRGTKQLESKGRPLPGFINWVAKLFNITEGKPRR